MSSRNSSRSSSRSRSRRRHRHRSRSPSPARRIHDPTKTPQELLSDFWARFHSKKQGKVTSIFPRSLYASLLPGSNAKDATDDLPRRPSDAEPAKNAAESYEAAARECRERVKRIVAECHRTNEKFTDPDFDIDSDPMGNCLYGLQHSWGWTFASRGEAMDRRRRGLEVGEETARGRQRGGARYHHGGQQTRADPARREPDNDPDRPQGDEGGVRCGFMMGPGSVHRVDWIFENPQFTVSGYSASDIKQGMNGDCWWLAAVATIAHRKDLMDRVCVTRDEECGVYGFCFFRDGEWVPCVVDDNLYLTRTDFDFYGDTYDPAGRRAERYRQRYQTGSEALYFARCEDQNETWLPLLEKAYAKAHCDYEAIDGGWSSEGVEDMTGGVGTTIAASKILSKDKLWRELASSDGEFVFALSAMGTGWDRTRNGLALGHAYSVLFATEEVGEDGKRVRLVKIRNPWGERDAYGLGEWTGPWSDGSSEWTPYWLKKLGHAFGDDGVFWMSFDDMLATFKWIHRTRLFDERWTVVSRWASANISWVTGYLRTKFSIEIKKPGKVVVVLTQLDDRYFVGLEGQYYFELHFVLQKKGSPQGEHVCRVRQVHKWENRSISCEVDLEEGVYEVIPKITASRRYNQKTVDDVIREHAEENPQKVRQVGMQYDLAHAKPGVYDYDLDLEKKKEEAKKKEEDKKAKAKAKKEKEKERERKKKEIEKKRKEQAKRRAEKLKAKAKERAEKAKKNREAARLKRKQENEERKKLEEAKADGSEKKDGEAAEIEVEKDDAKPEGTSEAKEDATKDNPKADDSKAGPSAEDKKSDGSWSDVSKPEAPGAPVAAEEGKDEEQAARANQVEIVECSSESSESESDSESDIASLDEASDDDDDDDQEAEEAEERKKKEEEEEELRKAQEHQLQNPDAPPPWNPVCVMGLRVYSMDAGVTVTLVEMKDEEESTSLTTDGEPAGATG